MIQGQTINIHLSLYSLPTRTRTPPPREDQYTKTPNPDDLVLLLPHRRRRGTFAADFRLFANNHTLQHSWVAESNCRANPFHIVTQRYPPKRLIMIMQTYHQPHPPDSIPCPILLTARSFGFVNFPVESTASSSKKYRILSPEVRKY